MIQYLTVAVRVSGHTWGTTQWAPLDCQWSRLDSAVQYAIDCMSALHAIAYRVYDKHGVVYAEGK